MGSPVNSFNNCLGAFPQHTIGASLYYLKVGLILISQCVVKLDIIIIIKFNSSAVVTMRKDLVANSKYH